jgi:PAS domain S-box-containing protein
MDRKTIKVLIVDDDSNLRASLTDILKVKGFESVPVATGRAALARIEKQNIDVALIDLKLQDMPGLEVLRLIKARSPGTECILLTGYATQNSAIEAINAGVYTYFQKPCDMDQLVLSIQRAGEKRAAGQVLQESEARFRSMIENSSDLICILNPDATLRYVSPSIERVMGYSIEEVVGGTGLQDYIHPDDIPVFMDAFRQRVQASDPSPVSMQLRIRHKDGTWRTLEGTGSNLLDHPVIEGIVINARDVTERKQVEETLRDSESRAKAMLQAIPDLMFRMDSQGVFLDYKADINDLYAQSEPTLIGKRNRDISPPEFANLIDEKIRTALETGTLQIFEYKLPIPGQGLRDYEARMIASGADEVTAIVRGITERKQAEEENRRMVERWSIVYRAGEEIGASLDTEQIFAAVHRAVGQVMPCEDFVISLYDEIRNEMAGNYIIENNKRVAPNPYQADHGLGGHIVHSGRSVLLNSPRQIKKSGIKFEPYGSGPVTASVVAVPLQIKGRTIGIISAQSYHSDAYTTGDQELLEMLASHAAAAIDNARLFEQARQEIAERKQAEEALRKSESNLQAVLQSTADGILAVGSENEVLYANERFAEMWRIPQAVMASKDDSVLLQHVLDQLNDPQSFLKQVQELYKSKKKSFDTLYFKDGRVFERLSYALMQGIKVRGRVWSFRDITARKQAEEALTSSEAELRALFASMHDVVLVIDCLGVYLKIAPTNPELLVKPPQELLGKTLRDVFPPEQAETFLRVMQQVLDTKQTAQIEYDLVIGDRTVWFETSISPMTEDSTLWVARDITERRQAEEALKESQQSYQALVERIPGVIYRDALDEIASTLFIGPQIKDMTGYAPEEWVAEPDLWLKILHPDDRLRVLAENKHHLVTGEPFKSDYRLLGRDGRVVWVRDEAVTICDSSGHPLYDQGVFTDITERKLAEEQIRLSEEHYRMLAENMSDTVWLMDLGLRTTYISPSVTRLRGFTLDEINTIPLDRQMPTDSLQRALGLFAETLSPENLSQPDRPISRSIELEFYKKDGTKFWSENTFTLIRDPQGQPFAILGSGRDISERKNAQEALQDNEKRFRLLIENNTDAVVLIDPRGMILYESPSYARMMGRVRGQRLGQSGYEYIHPEDRGSVAKIINELVQHPGDISHATYRSQHKDGSWRWIEATGTNLLGESAVHSLVINMHDITERKQGEEALRQAEAKYHNIFENSMEGIFQSTPAGKFSTANPALARMLGYALPEELIASVNDLNRKFYVQPERHAEFMKQLSEHGKIVNFESEIYRHDGGTIWISENVQAMRDHLGQILYYEGTLEDITKRKQAEEEIRRRVADLEVLYENGLSISVLLDPRKIAQKMIEILSQRLDWHHAAIRLYHPETRRMELLALNEPSLDSAQTQAEIDRLNKIFTSPGQGLSGWVIKHGRPVRSGDVQADKRYFSAFPDIHSGLYIPLMIGERAIGAIAVESRQANRFSKEDERLLQTLAAQAAIAFENARLYQEASRASERKAALHQGGLEIVRAGQDIEALCIALHHAAQQVMAAEAFTVSLLTEDGLEVEAPYLYDRGIRHPNTRLPVGAGITGRVIKSKKPLRLKDVQRTSGAKPIMVGETEPTRAVLSVPLLMQDKIIGVISAQSRDPGVYTAEDQIFMETLASEAAVAFENARLFEELRHHLAKLESLSQVSISLTSAIDLQPLLENILAGARNAIPSAEKGTILLEEPDGVLRLHAMSGYTDPRIIGLSLLPDQKGYAARVARERNPIKIDDAHAGYEVPENGAIEEIDAVQSGISAPLIVKGKVIGVISLDNASRKAAFTESDLRLLVTFASSAAVAIENARLFTETQQRVHRLSTLHAIDAAIGASVDTHVTLSIVLEHIITELKADAAAVLLFNPLSRMLEYAAGRGFHVHAIEGLKLRLGEGLAGQSALQRRAINIADLQQAGAVEQVMEHPVSGSASLPLQYLEGENFVSYHAIPLVAKGQLQGVLEIFRRTPMPVDQEWITFFEMLAGQTAIAIDNGRLFENLQHTNLELTLAYDATIQGWSQALELRDEETEGHTLRVTDLTLRLIQAMGIEEVETEHARRGALLHDIGKIAIPDSILLKAGPLEEHEWSMMRQHPQYAYNLLSPITYLRPALHIPWCHHEKWDGSGYPRGLKGEDIPMVARIFAIVDVYDALTSNRPYRLAWTREKTLEYIREQSGKHFDPKVVKAFMALLAAER